MFKGFVIMLIINSFILIGSFNFNEEKIKRFEKRKKKRKRKKRGKKRKKKRKRNKRLDLFISN